MQFLVWLVWPASFDKAEFSFYEQKTTFWYSFKRIPNRRLVWPMHSWSQSLHGMQQITFLLCSFVIRFYGYEKMCPNVKVETTEDCFNSFRNSLNIWNNLKSHDRIFVFIFCAWWCNWFPSHSQNNVSIFARADRL